MNQEKVGKLIAKLRKENKLTQEQLGKKLGVNSKAVSKWECGVTTPDISIVNNLASILGITTQELLSGTLEHDYKKNNIIQKFLIFLKKNILWFILTFFLFIINIFLIIFFYKNYKKYYYIEFGTFGEDDISVTAELIVHDKVEFVFLKDIIFQSIDIGTNSETKVSSFSLFLLDGEEIILNYNFNTVYNDDGSANFFLISDILQGLSVLENHKKNSEIFRVEHFNPSLKIFYISDHDETITKTYQLKVLNKKINSLLN